MANFLNGYLALGTGTTSFVEATDAGYARQAFSLPALLNAATADDRGMTFSGAGSVVSQFGIYDAATNGNLILWWNSNFLATLSATANMTVGPGQFQLLFPDLFGTKPSQAVIMAAGVQIGTVNATLPLYSGALIQFTAGQIGVV